MKSKLKIKDCYRVGDTVKTAFDNRLGVIIKVTSKAVTVKHVGSTSIYSPVTSIELFKEDIKVIGNIGYTLGLK